MAGSCSSTSDYTLCLGSFAGCDTVLEASLPTAYILPSNTIVMNASGLALAPTTSGFFVRPIAPNDGSVSGTTTIPAAIPTGTNLLVYNPSTNEVQYSTVP